MKFEISLFRFDAKSDYLPYYTKHFIKVEHEKNIFDLFKTIQKKESFDFVQDSSYGVVVNGLWTTMRTSLESIKKKLGNELKFEPLSIRRAYKDFVINEDDFYSKLKLLDFELSDEQKKEYENNKLYFYASNTLNINKNYIGDAFLLLSSELLKNKEVKGKVEEILKDEQFGAVYHTSLKNRVFDFDEVIEQKIKEVQKALNLTLDISKQKLKKGKNIEFEEASVNEIKHNFKDFNLAYLSSCCDNSCSGEMLEKLEVNFLDLDSLKDDLCLDTFHKNPEFTYKLASKVALDVFDSGADLLIVSNTNLFYLFDGHLDELQRVSQREIDLPVLHINEFKKLISGDHDGLKEKLKLHKIDPRII